MGKLADALDKAGYGEEDLQRVEEETQPHQKEQEPFALRQKEKPPPVAEYPDEIEIEIPEIPEPELQMESPSPAKTPEAQSTNDNSRLKPALVRSKSTQSTGAWDERLFKAVNKDTHIPEIFKLLRTRILHPKNGKSAPRTILVVAIAPQEGKSFIAANLGITLAQGVDQHSLLVDCDLRRPRLAGLFGIKAQRGLVDYLKEDADIPELLVQTSLNKLTVLPSGKPPVNPAELIGSTRMQNLIEALSMQYEDRILIFDSPPVTIASETTVLAGQVDGVLLVIRQGGSSKPQVKKFIDTVGSDKILGVVFNAQTSNILERSLLKGYGYYGQDEYN